jgi:Fe-S oxidoreductase
MTYSLHEINKKMNKLSLFLANRNLQVEETDLRTVLLKLIELKQIIGNIDNDVHFLASCLANSFLKKSHSVTIDLNKAVGSAGLDIELEEIVGEIKTTIPYHENDFGANQKENIRKDLERLEESDKKFKYFFVTDNKTETILKKKYSKHFPSVKIVNLLSEYF